MMWEQPPASTLTLADAQRTASAAQRFFDDLGSGVHHIAGGYEVTEADNPQYPFLVAHAVAVKQAVRQGIVLAALAAVSIATLLIAAAGSYWADRRRLEIALLVSRGVGPPAFGLKASLEMLIPVGIGAALGWSCGIGLVALIGPSSAFGSVAIIEALWFALGGAGVGLCLLGLVAGMRARTRNRAQSSDLAGTAGPGSHWRSSAWAWPCGFCINLGDVSLEAGARRPQLFRRDSLSSHWCSSSASTALFARLLVLGLRRPRLRTATKDAPVPLWLATRRLIGAPSRGGRRCRLDCRTPRCLRLCRGTHAIERRRRWTRKPRPSSAPISRPTRIPSFDCPLPGGTQPRYWWT